MYFVIHFNLYRLFFFFMRVDEKVDKREYGEGWIKKEIR